MAELDEFYDVCLKLTKEVGVVINKAFNEPKNITLKTADYDLVTETDKQVEEILILGLQKSFPDHKVIAEETASKEGGVFELTNEPTWIIDPIDGTLNFVHTYPLVAVSIALLINKRPVIGIVYNPVLEQLYTARAGKGAYLMEILSNVLLKKIFQKHSLSWDCIEILFGIQGMTPFYGQISKKLLEEFKVVE